MKRLLVGSAVLIALFLSTPAFSQSNASISGIITDATLAVLPGATVTVINTETGISKTAVSNAAGAYSFAGLQVGTYKASAELTGFQVQTFTDIQLGNGAQYKLNFTLQVRKLEQSVEVSVQQENLILESSSSVGMVLPEKRITELPLTSNNVLDLIKVMGGTTITNQVVWGANDTAFAGISANNINLQRDGVTVNDVRWTTGLNSPVTLNPELIGEFKMVLAPVDAEMGVGNGQVQLVTRSGSNAFHGSLVYNIQNSALDANEFGNNRQGVIPWWRNLQEYTISASGPIIKNKTFFFALWDGVISVFKDPSANPRVPTPCALKGIFRYWENWGNGNYQTQTNTAGATPTRASVNADGTPSRPATNPDGSPYTGQLRYYSVFGPLLQTPRTNDCSDVPLGSNGWVSNTWVNYNQPWDPDPTRKPDTTGYIQRFMKYVPPPNNWDVGDGLNWAGYRWTRRLEGVDNVFGLGEMPNRKQINFRIDHNFNAQHRLSGTYSYESNHADDSFPTWPQNSYGGALIRKPQSFAVNFTSTLKPTLLNEFRTGLVRPLTHTLAPIDNPAVSSTLNKALYDLMPTAGWKNWPQGVPILIGAGTGDYDFNYEGGSNVWGSGRGNFASTWGGHDPRWTYADTITWTKGRHSFKGGVEIQRLQSYQEQLGPITFGNGANTIPYAAGGPTTLAPIQGFNTTNMPGITGGYGQGDQQHIQDLLSLYSGSVSQVRQWYFANSPTSTTYNDFAKGENTRISDYRQNQFSLFFKDDWKLADTFTLNLGLRYEWYGVPYLANGMTLALTDGAGAIFGRSGRTFDYWQKPGERAADATMEFIGPGTSKPDKKIYNNDWNNFGPAVGFAWQLPWGGKGKTTLRGGYQLNYQTPERANNPAILYMPGTQYQYTFSGTFSQPAMNLASLPTMFPLSLPDWVGPPGARPTIAVDQRSQAISVYDPNLRAPYVHNITMALTRNFGTNITLDVRYIGTLSRKQTSTVNLNVPNFLRNGLLQAFNQARQGQNPELLDRMFQGVNIQGFGACGPVGTVCNGVLQRGGEQLRNSTGMYNAFYTTWQTMLANGDYNSLAADIAIANYAAYFPGNVTLPPYSTDSRGNILRHANTLYPGQFPENFILTSPQFASSGDFGAAGAGLVGNNNHANYHSMQAQVTIRPIHGLSLSSTYTWSRNLGVAGNTYTDPFDRAADYGLLGMHREHALVFYGAYELPFGPGRELLGTSSGAVARIVQGWQFSWIYNYNSGFPVSITAPSMLYANGVPDQVGPFDRKAGAVTWTPGSYSGNFYGEEVAGQPTVTKYTYVRDPQCNAVAPVLQAPFVCTLQAVADAKSGQIIFQNPQPGTRGNFGWNNLSAPGQWGLDMAISKAIKITEGKFFSLRVDATNILNHGTPSYGYNAQGVKVRGMAPPFLNLTPTTFDFTTFTFKTAKFGEIDNKVGSRTFQAKLRFEF